ncbi:MAG: hypothetical protein U1E81_20050 [Xanthobacteraceae bacterium]
MVSQVPVFLSVKHQNWRPRPHHGGYRLGPGSAGFPFRAAGRATVAGRCCAAWHLMEPFGLIVSACFSRSFSPRDPPVRNAEDHRKGDGRLLKREQRPMQERNPVPNGLKALPAFLDGFRRKVPGSNAPGIGPQIALVAMEHRHQNHQRGVGETAYLPAITVVLEGMAVERRRGGPEPQRLIENWLT